MEIPNVHASSECIATEMSPNDIDISQSQKDDASQLEARFLRPNNRKTATKVGLRSSLCSSQPITRSSDGNIYLIPVSLHADTYIL